MNRAPISVSSSRDNQLVLGEEFRGLRVHSLLAQGGMGAAYLASHPILRRPLVIKTFKEQSHGRDIFKEAYLAARVASPHTVTAIDAGFENGMPYLVQNYVDGIDLAELVRRMTMAGNRLPVGIVARFLVHAARGLHAVHQSGVVHCDVKPPNLFLRGNGLVTIGDFGVAISTMAEDSGDYSGSPLFAAPEQWEDGKLDRRSDVYALGATAHFLLRGKPPFVGTSSAELRKAHIEQEYQPPLFKDSREESVFSVVEKMLQKKPEDRYATTAAAGERLSQFEEPVHPYVKLAEHLYQVGPVRLTMQVGDLSQTRANVIVNAANTKLTMDEGVASALRREGGSEIEQEALRLAPVAMGDVVWTGPGKLHAKHVAHAVAALDGAICLQRATLRTLLECERRRALSVAFPVLGTGVAQVPVEQAAQLMLEAIRTYAELMPTFTTNIEIVLHTLDVYQSFLDIVESI